MGIFDKFIQKGNSVNKRNGRTTEGFHIGVVEAEGEANNSKIILSEVFEDYLDVISQINNEKFIVLGRKGSGKSAIGEYLYSLAESDANLFANFIRTSEINIERIIQVGEEKGERITQEVLYKWIILTQLLKLFLQNQKISTIKEMVHIKKFIERNRGFVDIRNNEIKEIIREKGFSIDLEYFKRFYTAKCNKKISIKEEKADFYKLIPYLEEIVIKILLEDKDNSYILIFDDLDIGYNFKVESSKEALIDLLRVTKYYNNEIFGRNGIKSKILILLRNDIAKHLRFNADTAKLFASYAVELNWFEEVYRLNEDKLKLKQFINKRIMLNFEKNNMEYIKGKPWESFVDESEFEAWRSNSKSSFKYVIDHTFFRPRDLILFFKDLNKYKFPIPLSKESINILIGNYANEMFLEIQNELSAMYSALETNKIINALRNFLDKRPFTYQELLYALEEQKIEGTLDDIIDELFYYSLIGNINDNGEVSFKFRENGGDTCLINRNENFILHNMLKVYYRKN